MQFLKPIHLTVGIVGLMAFVLTGQYLAIFLKGLSDMPDGTRLLYRTSHLYLMWGSLLNLIVGMYFVPAEAFASRVMQAVSSVLLIVSPVLMLAGFFIESPTGSLDRVLTGWGNYFALAGAILHFAVNLQSGRARTPSNQS
jgi:hypothetical protein